jgi:hypothetical protein
MGGVVFSPSHPIADGAFAFLVWVVLQLLLGWGGWVVGFKSMLGWVGWGWVYMLASYFGGLRNSCQLAQIKKRKEMFFAFFFSLSSLAPQKIRGTQWF